jgi:hypothetical protein
VAKTLPHKIQELIGYTMAGAALGYFDNGTNFASFPTEAFEEREGAAGDVAIPAHLII